MRYTSDPSNEPDPGMLGQVPGQFIAQGAATLPPADTAQGARRDADVSAGWVGPVRVTYLSQRMRHGRHSHWAWVAISAMRLPG